MNVQQRFVNLILILKKSKKENIWPTLKKFKLMLTFKDCNSHMYTKDQVEANIAALEDMFQVKSTDVTFANITEETLNTAAKMFIYLNTCSEDLKLWVSFFKDLFQNKPPDQIVLTLNRILKYPNTPISKKMFQRITTLFSLQYKSIRNLQLGNIDLDSFNNSKGKINKGCK